MTTTLISTDEAGYGPNLGPLMIAATSWTVENVQVDLYQQLREGVSNQLDSRCKNRLLITDSKEIHRAGSLQFLEQNVLSVLHSVTGQIPGSLKALLKLVAPIQSVQNLDCLEQQVWLKGVDVSLPIDAELEIIHQLSDRFSTTCDAADVKLERVECDYLFADEFNREVKEVGNKANLLSGRSLHMVKRLLEAADPSHPIQIGCDKHGGRSKYAALIQHYLKPDFVRVKTERLEISEYEFSDAGRSVKLWFAARGESFLPTALSSMFAKYIREAFMVAWNHFWMGSISDLKPTQGYPQDAKRFIRQIESARQKLGIPLEAIWRER